jgi:hypothetical protein
MQDFMASPMLGASLMATATKVPNKSSFSSFPSRVTSSAAGPGVVLADAKLPAGAGAAQHLMLGNLV